MGNSSQLFLLNKRQIRPLVWWLCCIFGFSFLKGRLKTEVVLFWLLHYSLFLFLINPRSVPSTTRWTQDSYFIERKISKIKFAQSTVLVSHRTVSRFDLNDNFFKLESFTKHLARACYACRTDSWSFSIFEWMPLLASSFQQYIIGTQELHIFPSFLELVVIGRNISLGSVLPFSHEPDNMLAAYSSPSSLGCTLRCGVLRMMGKGRFYCICSEVLLLYVFSMFHILWRKNPWK